MKRFIEGEDRTRSRYSRSVWTTTSPKTIRCGSSTCSLMSSIWRRWALMVLRLRSRDVRRTTRRPSEDLHLRLPQSHSIEPAPGARGQRNLELIWLTGRCAGLQDDRRFPQRQRPRRSAGLPGVRCAVPASSDLFSEAIVAIDGSKFKAVNNRDKNFTAHKLKPARSRSTRASRAISPPRSRRPDPSLRQGASQAPRRRSSPRSCADEKAGGDRPPARSTPDGRCR